MHAPNLRKTIINALVASDGAGTEPPVPIDLVRTDRDSQIQLTPWLLSKGLDLVFDVCDNISLAKVDPAAINIVLNNLMTNAANFSPRKPATNCPSRRRGRASMSGIAIGFSSVSTAAEMIRGQGWG
ncbi:hypothetical protein BMS17_20280 [Pseudomonas sp. C9]|nr:hypothetical protein BMS17_20280 [Pseudomonas sp. C9]